MLFALVLALPAAAKAEVAECSNDAGDSCTAELELELEPISVDIQCLCADGSDFSFSGTDEPQPFTDAESACRLALMVGCEATSPEPGAAESSGGESGDTSPSGTTSGGSESDGPSETSEDSTGTTAAQTGGEPPNRDSDASDYDKDSGGCSVNPKRTGSTLLLGLVGLLIGFRNRGRR